MANFKAVSIVALFLVAGVADAVPRSYAAKAEFKRLNPCPANGHRRGPCPGWIVDHYHPLCAGGIDHHSNMQWQMVFDAKAKDREEIRLCRFSKNYPASAGFILP